MTNGKLYNTGHIIVTGCLFLGIVLTILVVSTGSLLYSVSLPIIIIGAVVICTLFANPTINLVTVVIGFAVIASNEMGFQITEVIYAVYLFAVLGSWFLYQGISSQQILVDRTDLSLALFLLLLPFTLILTGLFQGDYRVAVSELISLSMFLIYFPVKHVVAEHKYGPKFLLLTIVAMSALVALINVFEYASDLLGATQLWQIAGSRVPVNDCLLLVGSLMSLVLIIHARGPVMLLLSASSLVLTFAGLIMTQARGSWLAFLLGAIILTLLVRRPEKVKILFTGSIVTVLILGVGLLLVGPFLNVIVEGISERFVSIASSITQDLSLINRFRETYAVFEKIIVNPLIGYGPGVSYLFYDIVHQTTHMDTFVHNGYIAMWYKYGLWGLGLVLIFWYSATKLGLRAFQSDITDLWTRLAGLAGSVPLIAVTISTLTQNPFFLKNYLFIIALAAGLAAGAGQRESR